MPYHRRMAALAFILPLAAAFAGEKKLNRSQVPQVVLDGFAKAYPAAQVRGYTSEREKGTTVFEVESISKGHSLDVSFSAEGLILATEEAIELADVPPAIVRSVHNQFGRTSTIVRAEKVSQKGRTLFEIGLRNAVKREQLYTSDGIPTHE